METPAITAAAVPVDDLARVRAVDAARGFALLGIFLVNIAFFSGPLGAVMQHNPPADRADAIVFFAIKILAEFKFYGLFSLLFGIGFALQRERVAARGVTFWPVYVRRIVFLFLLGLFHALFLWYGDILFIYSIAAVILLLFGKARPRTLVVVGIIVFTIATLLGVGITTAMQASQRPAAEAVQAPAAPAVVVPEAVVPEVVAAETGPPFERFWNKLTNNEFEQGPQSPGWMALETEAYIEGGYWQAFGFRAITWASMLVFCIFGFGWTIVAMFFFGAALAKRDAFNPAHGAWHRRFLLLGAGVGLPMCAVGVSLLAVRHDALGIALGSFLSMFGAPLMSLGYLAGITRLVHAGRLGFLTRAFEAAGRMALTNYLTQTVVATFVFYHWGLAQFGSWSRAEGVALVVTVYLCQLVISTLWLRRFRYGPMEWLWRSFTYLRAQPMRR